MIFSVEHLSAGYRGKRVLKDVGFAVQPHKITALLGRNGCGKSTLLACVNQQVAYTGKIVCCDRDVRFMTPRERAAAVAILPQVLAAPAVTVRELTAFGRAPYNGWGGRLSDADHGIIAQAMADAGVADLADRLVSELSGGERQKAYIAMILAQNTRLVLLDEPTTYLDAAGQAVFMRMLETLRSRHKKTILLVLHDLQTAARYADNAVVLQDGTVRFSGSMPECLDSGVLQEVFSVTMRRFTEDGQEYVLFEGK